MAYTLVRHLEQKVRLQYQELSPNAIKTVLLGVLQSLLYDTKQNKMFALPSDTTIDAHKIYKLIEVKLNTKPYIL